MADLITAAQFGVLLLVFLEDVAFENFPLARLAVGVIAWPMPFSLEAEGDDHGLV